MTEVNKKLMLAGLFLAKFNQEGLDKLGFTNWNEAYNTLALSIGGRPKSVKGYRDEFDVLFPWRAGWRNRPMHEDRKALYDALGGLEIDEFAELVRKRFADDGDIDIAIGAAQKRAIEHGDVPAEETSFAKRMLTGQVCENYFEKHYREYEAFSKCSLKRTTNLGCGFDFKLTPPSSDFLAVEVKGMRTPSGLIQMTDKEFQMAGYLEHRFFLYVLSDLADTPRPIIIENPLASGIQFEPKHVKSVQTVWVGEVSCSVA